MNAARPTTPPSRGQRVSSRLAGDGLTLGFGRTTVVQDVSVELVPGRVTALVGAGVRLMRQVWDHAVPGT